MHFAPSVIFALAVSALALPHQTAKSTDDAVALSSSFNNAMNDIPAINRLVRRDWLWPFTWLRSWSRADPAQGSAAGDQGPTAQGGATAGIAAGSTGQPAAQGGATAGIAAGSTGQPAAQGGATAGTAAGSTGPAAAGTGARGSLFSNIDWEKTTDGTLRALGVALILGIVGQIASKSAIAYIKHRKNVTATAAAARKAELAKQVVVISAPVAAATTDVTTTTTDAETTTEIPSVTTTDVTTTTTDAETTTEISSATTTDAETTTTTQNPSTTTTEIPSTTTTEIAAAITTTDIPSVTSSLMATSTFGSHVLVRRGYAKASSTKRSSPSPVAYDIPYPHLIL